MWLATTWRICSLVRGPRIHEDGDLAAEPHTQHVLLAEALGWPLELVPPLLAVLSRHGLITALPGSTYGTQGTTFVRPTLHGARLLVRLDTAAG